MPTQVPDVRPVAGPGRWWAVLQFPVTRIVVGTIAVGIAIAIVQLIFTGLDLAPGGVPGALLVALGGCACIAVYAGFVKRVERRGVVELCTDGLPADLGRGLALGIGLSAATIAVLLVAGYATIEPGAGPLALLPGLLLAIAAATTEEIVFRGLLFRIVEERLGSWIALAISAAVFGALHIFNPAATIASAAATAIEAGVLLGAAYMWSRRLWFPIALHTGWNFAQIGIFGIQTPGRPLDGALASRFSGPTILTGGDYGPDLSIQAVAFCLIAAIFLLVLARRHGRIIGMPRPEPRGWIPL